VTGPTADLALTLAGLAAEATAPRLTHYRVDATHSNAYTPWQSLGSPVAPTKPQYLQLEAAAQLATLANATATVAVTGGTATLAFPLPRQAVSLLVLQW
jgi:xylan 1,4-beta-xylosidase